MTAKNTNDRITRHVRLSPELEGMIAQAAYERDISFNLFVVKACQFYLSKLIPIHELKMTKDENDDEPTDLPRA